MTYVDRMPPSRVDLATMHAAHHDGRAAAMMFDGALAAATLAAPMPAPPGDPLAHPDLVLAQAGPEGDDARQLLEALGELLGAAGDALSQGDPDAIRAVLGRMLSRIGVPAEAIAAALENGGNGAGAKIVGGVVEGAVMGLLLRQALRLRNPFLILGAGVGAIVLGKMIGGHVERMVQAMLDIINPGGMRPGRGRPAV